MRRVLVVVSASLVASAVLIGPAAAAGGVACGATLTVDTTLTTNMSCAAGTGLTLSGDVTLDLGGHRLLGPGTGLAVAVTDGSTVTVTNGRIQGWGVGLGDTADGSFTAAVTGVTFARTGTAIQSLFDSVAVDGSRFVDNGTGISGFFAATTVTDSVFVRNELAAANDEGSLSIVDSSLSANPRGLACGDGCTVTRTTFRQGTTALSGGMTVTDSVIAHYTNGVVAAGSFPFGAGVTVTGTRFTGNGTAAAVGGSGSLTLRSSTFRDNVVGFTTRADGDDATAYLEGNTFTRNGSGILATVPGVRLKANMANRNISWGIHAPGAVDLGGNTARGNGRSPQCVGVVCASSV